MSHTVVAVHCYVCEVKDRRENVRTVCGDLGNDPRESYRTCFIRSHIYTEFMLKHVICVIVGVDFIFKGFPMVEMEMLHLNYFIKLKIIPL